ncbi:unnamed protein product [Lathyrus sativus]|nr:unnamed protein product [Lathyrus sativus]
MANWRKNQGISNHQVGHWGSSSYNGKPPLDNRFPTVPSWEKKFCASVGSVPWKKVIEVKRYMHMHSNVVNWEDSAVKEAFDNAKNRFWAEINGFHCDIPLPDPNMYIDDVDWDASVDPELYLDLDRELEASRSILEKSQETVILGSSLLLNQSLSGPGWGIEPTGWGDEEEVTKPPEPNPACGWGWGTQEEVTKPPEPSYAANGWGSNYHENNETNSWEQNDSQRWIRKEQYGGDLHDKYQASNGWNRNWGAWEGNNRRRENNISWSKNQGYHHDNNEYRGRRNGGRGGGGGGRRGNYTYAPKVAATPSAW